MRCFISSKSGDDALVIAVVGETNRELSDVAELQVDLADE